MIRYAVILPQKGPLVEMSVFRKILRLTGVKGKEAEMKRHTSSSQFGSTFRAAWDLSSTGTRDYLTFSVSALIRACADGEAEAWQEFMRRFHRIITITACRVARRWGEN